MVTAHTFPPSQPTPIRFDQKQPFDTLTHAYRYVCDQFHAALTREQMKANIDARVLLLQIRDAFLGDADCFKGDTISSVEEMVKKAEGR